MTVLTPANAFPNGPFPQHLIVSGLNTATYAWINAVRAAGSTVSIARQVIVDNLIVGLKSAGLFSILDILFLFAAENTQQSLIDIIATGTAVNNGSVPFTANNGYGQNSSDGIEPAFIPATAGGNYSQNSASIGTWLYSRTGTSGGADVNIADTGSPSDTSIFSEYSDGNTYLRCNDAFSSAAVQAYAGTGFYQAVRTSSTARTGYLNGSQIQNVSNTSGPITNGQLRCGGSGSGNGVTAILALGGGMTSTQAASLYGLLNTYMTAI